MERDELTMLVAANIEALMKARRMTAASLGRAAGLNPTGIYDILSGKSQSPKIMTLGKIANALEVPIKAIFEDDSDQDIALDVKQALNSIPPKERMALLVSALASLQEETP